MGLGELEMGLLPDGTEDMGAGREIVVLGDACGETIIGAVLGDLETSCRPDPVYRAAGVVMVGLL